MDKCPNEVLALIFAEACTDDGLAGRSLSLVSRRVHDISRRHALQSVALYGFYQLSTFASLLDKSDPEDRNIRHLYVSDRPRGWIEYLPGQGREDWLATRVDEHFHFDDPSPNHSTSSLLHILKTVSPTLETLALLLFDRYDKQPLSDALCLPKLRELTLHGSNLTRPDHSELAQCLALRRLHVVQNVSIRGSMTKAVSHLAPLLTHLRISRIVANRFASGDVVLGLESMLQQDDLASTGFPSTLKCVLVQMLQVGTQDRNGHAAVSPSLMAQQLKDVAMRDVRRRIVLLKPTIVLWGAVGTLIGEISDVEFYAALKLAWQERVAGKESAVWEVESSSILASYGYYAEEG